VPAPESPAADVWTVGRIIDWTTAHLKKHDSDTPRLDAEILLAHARKCPRIRLYVDYTTPLTEGERGTMRDLVRRRALAEPVAYLVGHREFFGLDFRVSPAVLIPRPETETLVLELLTEAKKCGVRSAECGVEEGNATSLELSSSTPHSEFRTPHSSPLRILDVGTGSGCIAIACAVHLPESSITAIDISPQALAVARENSGTHNVSQRIRFLEGDLFAPLAPDEKFDLIASNPPYVADGEMESLPPDIRKHEPHLALKAGPKGLDVIERLIAGATRHLAPGGFFLVEFSPEQAPAVTELFATSGQFEPARIVKDPAGNLRIAVAKRLGIVRTLGHDRRH
jgi:release factor glutamine methyltransferase